MTVITFLFQQAGIYLPEQLKHTATILLLLAFAVQIFSKAFIVAGYYANTAAYAKNCENKAKPTMRCNGKCQMMKKLKQEDNKDKQNPERKAENKDEVLSSKSFYTTMALNIIPRKTTYPFLTAGRAIEMPHSIFHPPGYNA